MMARHHQFGKTSTAHLLTVHRDLQVICRDALFVVPFDLTVTCGRRSREDQQTAVAEGRSKVHWPDGNHNVRLPGELARAVDIHPYPVDFQDVRRYYILGGVMLACAHELDVDLRWGGDWDGDGTLTDQTFNDLPHFELPRD